MSWIHEQVLSWVVRFCFYVLKCGSVPKHVAFIMDGNRRFSKKNSIKKADGYMQGFDKLTETVHWCIELEIYEITVYAFSIENFKRNGEEVDTLMDLARLKFKALINEWEKLQEHGVCVRIIGNLTHLPKDLLTLMLISMLLTKNNKRVFLNIALSYTCKEEMNSTADYIINALRRGKITNEDINEKLFEECMYTHRSRHPELVIRTSGEHRLSDFLTWQSADSYIHVTNVLWPEFSAWNFMAAVFCYQHYSVKANEAVLSETRNTVDLKPSTNVEKSVQEDRHSELNLDIDKLVSLSPWELYDYFKTHYVEVSA